MFGRTASDPFASPCYRPPAAKEERFHFFPPDLVNGAETGSFPPSSSNPRTHSLTRQQSDRYERQREDWSSM